ncbi:hypothetical protein WLE50_000996 [Campylobacter coli]
MTILTSFDNEAEMDETIFADYLFDFSNLYKLANHYADDYVVGGKIKCNHRKIK